MKTRRTSFAIAGMREACANCAMTIERALARLDGVVAAQINYATERATVVYDPLRVSLSELVRAVQGEGIAVPQQRIVLDVDDLIYASSARTVARVVERVEGIIHARINLESQRIELDVLAEQAHRAEYQRAIANLGLRVGERVAPNPTREFTIRTFFILALTLLSLLSASAHAGWFDAGFIHTPLVVMIGAVIITYGIAWRFYRVAFETALLHNEFDASVIIALIASASLFIGLPLALLAPMSSLTTSGFVVAMMLTAGWFIKRSTTLWFSSRIYHPTLNHSRASQTAVGIISNGARR